MLPAGVGLLEGVAEALMVFDVDSAMLVLQAGYLSPMSFVMPARSSSQTHAVYYSDRIDLDRPVRIESGCITYGQRDGKPWLHCHALWTEADGRQRCGHVLPDLTRVGQPLQLEAWLLDGAGFDVAADAETNFDLFQPVVRTQGGRDGTEALVVRICPNEDLCTTLESLCAERGIRCARLQGVGSLIGAVFADGRVVEPFITEAFIRNGEIAPGDDGRPYAWIDIGLVDYTGQCSTGVLVRGGNPVLVTFEVVVTELCD